MPRGPRLDAPGSLHHVIARGIERRLLFVDDIDRQDLLRRLAALAAGTGTAVFAWALLPNHFHLLVRTDTAPLSDFMRSLNTGYAVGFNRRHRRAGYLFQNRFKSFLVEEEPYLLELVRYIHLNPLRAHLVRTLQELDGFPWTGHAAVLGRIERPWQAVQSVLALFGGKPHEARAAYRDFVAKGVAEDRRPELAGGGLQPRRGAWLRRWENIRGRDVWAFDERILGSPEFMERVLGEHADAAAADPPVLSPTQVASLLSALLPHAAAQCGAAPAEVTSSSHRTAAVAGRTLLSYVAVLHLGISSNAVARFLGVTRQSVRRGLQRADQVLPAMSCDATAILGSVLHAHRGREPAASSHDGR